MSQNVPEKSDSRRVFTWKVNGTHFHPFYVTKIDRFDCKRILVSGGIILGSCTPLYVFDAGIVNSHCKRDGVLQAYLSYTSEFNASIAGNSYGTRFLEGPSGDSSFLPEPLQLSDEAHFWLNGYVNKQNYRIWSEANPQMYVETPLHPEKLTVWCALWAGGILLQKR
ncbi:hypothetical protein TNCV_4677001 [Trichonephila clavipes]|nr:hypothetical protein TNCV_4677001 [Trichonephila clavipes]